MKAVAALKFTDEDYFFEPLIIEYDEEIWINPAIELICNFDYDCRDDDVHAFFLETKSHKPLTVVIKSPGLDHHLHDPENFAEELVEFVACGFAVTLTEDKFNEWAPDGTLFRATKLGRAIAKEFNDEEILGFRYMSGCFVFLEEKGSGIGWECDDKLEYINEERMTIH